ncbi:Lsr2 family DNA-binding protein [Streptomyces canus]|uniref:Lsr2 family DNA-binding protein n=1 Tax=Streptomyces canus TaxID=58343 RepID=UPI003FA27CDE
MTALKPFTEKSRERVVSSAARPAAASSSGTSSARANWLAEVREWALSVGHKVSDRGRIAQEIRDAYVKANPEKPEPTA